MALLDAFKTQIGTTLGGGGINFAQPGFSVGIKFPTPQAITNFVTKAVQPAISTAGKVWAATPLAQPDQNYYAELARIQAERNLKAQQEAATAQSLLAAVAAGRRVDPARVAEAQRAVSSGKAMAASGGNITGGGGAGGGTNTTMQSPGQITVGQDIPGVQPLTYDWTSEVQTAYNSLADFYQKVLDFAGGRLDLAKRMLEYTYQQGMRETTEEFESKMGEWTRVTPQETAAMQTGLNKRGVLSSGFGAEDTRILAEGQEARKTAIERAKANAESRLTQAKGFGMEEAQQTYGETTFDLERQRRKEAEQMAANKYNLKSTIFGAELDKQMGQENRNIRNITSGILSSVAGGGRVEPTGPIVTKDGASGRVADNTGRLYGGWYVNPATGKSQRYWGSNTWTDQ